MRSSISQAFGDHRLTLLRRETDKIPVALLVATPGNGVPPDFMECVARQVEDQKRTVLVKLTVGQTTNLKIVLKMINMLATSQGNQLGNENSVEEPRVRRPYAISSMFYLIESC